MRILLDTNILLRNAVPTDTAHSKVSRALQQLILDGWILCVGMQNIVEFWVVATRPIAVNGFGLAGQEALQEIEVLRTTYVILPGLPAIQDEWLDLCKRYSVLGRQAHDAHLVALMLSHRLTHLLTLNPGDFKRFEEIKVFTPDDI